MILVAALSISLGTYFGGWRIIRTLGTKVIHLDPIHGFAAETARPAVIFTASHLGYPISTTHTITASIMGSGATGGLSAVKWGVAGNIVWAWVLTIPAAAGVAAGVYFLIHLVSVGSTPTFRPFERTRRVLATERSTMEEAMPTASPPAASGADRRSRPGWSRDERRAATHDFAAARSRADAAGQTVRALGRDSTSRAPHPAGAAVEACEVCGRTLLPASGPRDRFASSGPGVRSVCHRSAARSARRRESRL